MKLIEASSLAETQESICVDIALRVKQAMLETDSATLTKTTISETVGPDPLCSQERELTIHYWLKPITLHSGLVKDGEALMTRIHACDGMYCDYTPLCIVSVPMDEEGVPQLPTKFDDWNVVYEIDEHRGVSAVLDTKPDEDDLTLCRIILEDAAEPLPEAA